MLRQVKMIKARHNVSLCSISQDLKIIVAKYMLEFFYHTHSSICLPQEGSGDVGDPQSAAVVFLNRDCQEAYMH